MPFEKFEKPFTFPIEAKEETEETVIEREITPEEIPEEAKDTLSKIKEAGFEGYFVGGCVRDLLLEKEPKDWDITTNAKPEEIQEIFPKSFYENKFGTVSVITKSKDPTLKVIEITPYRLEGKYTDKRHPDEIKFTQKLEEDLKRRDFTINALAATFEENKIKIIDLFGGKEDLKNKLIRTVGNPKERFSEDALRLMRAVRFSAQLGFEIEENTAQAIKENAPLLEIIAKERVKDELVKIMESPDPVKGVKLLKSLNLWEHIAPEIDKRIEEKTLFSRLEKATENNFNLGVRFAAFFRDIEQEKEELTDKKISEILDRLKFPKEFKDKIPLLVKECNSLSDLEDFSKIEARYLWRKISKNQVIDQKTKELMEDLVNLRSTEIIKETEFKKLEKVNGIIKEVANDPIFRRQLQINGKDVMKTLNIKPSPKVGEFLNILLKEVIENPSRNRKEYLISRLKQLSQEI